MAIEVIRKQHEIMARRDESERLQRQKRLEARKAARSEAIELQERIIQTFADGKASEC